MNTTIIPKPGTSFDDSLTTRIKLRDSHQLSVQEALRLPRLIRKDFEAPLFKPPSGSLLVGREKEVADIIIEDNFISRTHAALVFDGNQIFLKDLHSKNGTFLNCSRLASGQQSVQPLKNGDKVGFNGVEFKFVIPKSTI